MSNLQQGIDQRRLVGALRFCAHALEELNEGGRPSSERAHRKQAQQMSAVHEALMDISNRMEENTARTKGTAGSQYVIQRQSTAAKWEARDLGHEVPSTSIEKVHAWNKAKRQLDKADLPTPKRGKKKQSPQFDLRNSESMEQDDCQEKLVHELISCPPETKLDIPEAVRQLSNLQPGKNRNKVINAWSKDQGNGIVNMNRRGLEKRMKKLDAGNEKKAFKRIGQTGRDPVATVQETKDWVQSHQVGETFGLQEVRAMLDKKNGTPVSDKSVYNYFAVALAECETKTNASIHKQPHRHVAESSLRRVQSFAVNVLGSHILPGPSAVSAAPDKNHPAVRTVSLAYGGIEVHTLDPAMIFNTDDMSVQIHTGDTPKSQCRGVPHKGDQIHYASYNHNNPDPAVYMSVHMTHIATADGQSGPVVIRVKVKEREWTGESGDTMTSWRDAIYLAFKKRRIYYSQWSGAARRARA